MVYLITGIAGFIGSSLAHALLGRGETLRGIDNFSTGRRENLADIAGRVDVSELDLSQPSDALHDACRGVDYILHQAALPSVPRSGKDPEGSNRANVNGTLKRLIAAKSRYEQDRRL